MDITICLGSSCYTRGNDETIKSIQLYLEETGNKDRVNFKGELCSCNCKSGPNLKINDKIHHNIDQNSAIAILLSFIKEFLRFILDWSLFAKPISLFIK